jgi:hypothetical protein
VSENKFPNYKMERLSQANLRPTKSWKGNLTQNNSFKQSSLWRTTENNNNTKSFLDFQIFFQNFLCIDISFLKKQVIDFKYNTIYGTYWDILQVFISILSCAIFVSETYVSTYHSVQLYNLIEQIITQIFMIDFLLSWFVSFRSSTYFSSPMTWVDIITILPSYLIYLQNTPDLSTLRFVRILRLIRILRTFRLLGGFSGVKKQMITICLLILSLTFLAAGIYNLCENDFEQFSYDCQYINKDTSYQPSCTRSRSSYDDSTCDCQKYNCHSKYFPGDLEGQPSLIKCSTIGFLESYYFTVVTICSVGYGDFSPTNQAARIIIMIYIATAFIMIPIQINKLEQLITMNSKYRTFYHHRPNENHIILCGHVNDKQKLIRIFREFFHSDHLMNNYNLEINICILCTSEPNDEVKELLSSPLFENRVSYIIGSALNMEDLYKARGDIASAMFFLSNIEVDEEDALLDDAATVLRTLSVNNFNSNLDCYVQILRSQERDLLKDSNVAELILCYDEYKTIIQARNAICPGLATMIENLFHTFGIIKYENILSSYVTNDWLSEYSYGARMEIYYIPIDQAFFGLLGYSWPLLVEAIYLEFECLLVGVCNLEEYSAHFNPRLYERKKYLTLESYFEHYSLGLLIAPNNSVATAVRYALNDPNQMEIMIENLHIEERQFTIRRAPEDILPPPSIGNFLSASVRALNVGKSFRTTKSVKKIDIESLKTEDIANLRKIQQALDHETQQNRSSLPSQLSTKENSAIDPGMDSDSSEENDDDFLGYIEHDSPPPHHQQQTGTGEGGGGGGGSFHRRVGLLDSSLSKSFVKSFEKPLSVDVKLSPHGSFSEVTSSSSPSGEINLLDTLDQHQDNKTLRPPRGMVSLKSIQSMKRAASSRKMSSLKAFRNTVVKKNKVKSLKQAASLIKTVNKLNAGGAGGFAALVKAAAAAESTPDNLVAKPASLVTAFQQTRVATKQPKLSIFDAIKLAKVKEAISASGTEPSETLPSLSSSQPSLPLDQKKLYSEPEEWTITQDIKKFQTIREESVRNVLATRTSSCMITDTLLQPIEQHDPHLLPLEGGGVGGGGSTSPRLKSQNSLGTNRALTRAQSKGLARALSRGAGPMIQKALSRADSSIGEIITMSTVTDKNAILRRSAQLGQFSKTRRPSVDSGLNALTSVQMKGRPSDEIEDASHLKNHIIVFGCMDYISIFVLELRKKLISDSDYRPILIVSPQEPRKWYQIRTKQNDIFLLTSTVTSAQDLILMNIRDAHALVLLAHRQAISVDETSNVDSESLFLYLTIEKLIPRNVFFTVELCRPNNMGVLNSVIVRRNKIEKNTILQPKNMTALATAMYGNDSAGTGLSLKLRGSHKFRGSVDISGMMNRLQSEKVTGGGGGGGGGGGDEKSSSMSLKLTSRRANVFTVPDLTNVPTRSLSISSMISSNPALHSKNQLARRKFRANRKVCVMFSPSFSPLSHCPLTQKAHTINFWDVDDTHHVLPVFASGKAVCPTAFDSILCQVRPYHSFTLASSHPTLSPTLFALSLSLSLSLSCRVSSVH